MDYSPPGSSVHGIFQAKILELHAISYSRGSSHLGIESTSLASSCISRQILYDYATWEAQWTGNLGSKMFLWVLWNTLAYKSKLKRMSWEPWVSSWLVRSTGDDLDLPWYGGWRERRSCRTESLTCGRIPCYLQVRCQCELNCRTSTQCQCCVIAVWAERRNIYQTLSSQDGLHSSFLWIWALSYRTFFG